MTNKKHSPIKPHNLNGNNININLEFRLDNSVNFTINTDWWGIFNFETKKKGKLISEISDLINYWINECEKIVEDKRNG